MKKRRYAVYPPPKDGLPFLAVVLSGRHPTGMFGCPDHESATELLAHIRLRAEATGNDSDT
jgi:hypothetical protein